VPITKCKTINQNKECSCQPIPAPCSTPLGASERKCNHFMTCIKIRMTQPNNSGKQREIWNYYAATVCLGLRIPTAKLCAVLPTNVFLYTTKRWLLNFSDQMKIKIAGHILVNFPNTKILQNMFLSCFMHRRTGVFFACAPQVARLKR
jgi:hypothetical protein